MRRGQPDPPAVDGRRGADPGGGQAPGKQHLYIVDPVTIDSTYTVYIPQLLPAGSCNQHKKCIDSSINLLDINNGRDQICLLLSCHKIVHRP